MAKSTAATRRKRHKPSHELLERIAHNVRVLRVHSGFTQERLADVAELDRTYIGDLEHCRHNPSAATLEALAVALEVDVVEIVSPIKAPRKRRL